MVCFYLWLLGIVSCTHTCFGIGYSMYAFTLWALGISLGAVLGIL